MEKEQISPEWKKRLHRMDRADERKRRRFNRRHILCGSATEAERRGYKKRKPRKRARKKAPPRLQAHNREYKKALKHWQRLFDLQAWEIRPTWTEHEKRAEIEMCYPTQQANVQAEHGVIPEGELDETMCHECLHVMFHEVHHLIDTMLSTRMEKLFNDYMERGINRVTDVLVKLDAQNRKLAMKEKR